MVIAVSAVQTYKRLSEPHRVLADPYLFCTGSCPTSHKRTTSSLVARLLVADVYGLRAKYYVKIALLNRKC